MSAFHLREAKLDDRQALLELWVAAWSRAMPAIDFIARRAWFASRLAEFGPSGAQVVVGCDAAGTIGGFIVFEPAVGRIPQLAVTPALQGSGLASVLMNEVKRRADVLTLDVNQDNPRAVRFYLREGFAIAASGVNPRSNLPTWRMEWRQAPRSERDRCANRGVPL